MRYSDSLTHGHKYVKRVRDRDGNWRYYYKEDLTPKEHLNRAVTGAANDVKKNVRSKYNNAQKAVRNEVNKAGKAINKGIRDTKRNVNKTVNRVSKTINNTYKNIVKNSKSAISKGKKEISSWFDKTSSKTKGNTVYTTTKKGKIHRTFDKAVKDGKKWFKKHFG